MRRQFGAIRNAVMAILPMLGRFGANKDTSPESFMPAVDITGSGPGKNAKRHNRTKPQPRAVLKSDHFDIGDERREQTWRAWNRSLFDANIPGSMRGGDWLRSNRYRRAVGLRPFKAADLPF